MSLFSGRNEKKTGNIQRLFPGKAPNSAVREANRKVASILKGVFHIATLISDFDLRLSFMGGKINRSAEKLITMFSGVASSSEEISLSTNQIVNANAELAGAIDIISQDAEVLNKNTKKSNEILTGMKAENTEMMVFSKDMDQSIQDLLQVIQKINEAVKGISDISNQTEILSINAAIEATRAGAAGKGFAVVADEIRALSGTTKKLTANIDALLNDMNSASNKSKGSVAKTLESIGRVGGSIETVSSFISASADATGNITSRILDVAQTSRGISDSLQESSTALESVNNDIQNLSRSAEELKSISDSIKDVSISIGKIEGMVDHLATASGEVVSNKICGLSNEDFIETVENAIKAHRNWMTNVKGMAKDMQVVPVQTDEHKCGFGHFYYAVKPSSPKLKELWDSVEALHHALHKSGDRIINHIQVNDSRSARNVVLEAEKLSETIIGKFGQMITTAKEMSASGEPVF